MIVYVYTVIFFCWFVKVFIIFFSIFKIHKKTSYTDFDLATDFTYKSKDCQYIYQQSISTIFYKSKLILNTAPRLSWL